MCCGGGRLRKLGETVTETLELIPRQWKVIQHVREKFTCRDCEKISQAPAPFHVIARGWAGPSLLAMILFEKFGQHQPLNRQAERYAKEGVPLSLSTLADQVGAGCAVLEPILRRFEEHVFAAERLHSDDTTVPVLAKGKTATGRCWVYVRDDRPFGGTAPPAAMFYYSRDRTAAHPQAMNPAGGFQDRPRLAIGVVQLPAVRSSSWRTWPRTPVARRHLANYNGIFQADAYSGYNKPSPWRCHCRARAWRGARASSFPDQRPTVR